MISYANHAQLARYFNTGQFSRYDLFIGSMSPALLFRKNASEAIRLYNSITPSINANQKEIVNVSVYNGSDQVVHKMSTYLKEQLSDDLAGAFVHGSLATHERIGYSDFDGLLILKDEVFESTSRLATVAQKISRSFSIMISFDPLQHHGWSILTEKDLTCFPDTYFPVVLFNHAASLLPWGLQFEVKTVPQDGAYSNQLNRLAASVIRKIDNGKGFRNMFSLKGILSEFMLLPSLYLESKLGKGVFKKESFELARKDFNESDWSIMDEVSGIRSHWNYTPAWTIGNAPVPVTPLTKKIQANKAGAIPEPLVQLLNASFTARMRNLASLFIEKGV